MGPIHRSGHVRVDGAQSSDAELLLTPEEYEVSYADVVSRLSTSLMEWTSSIPLGLV